MSVVLIKLIIIIIIIIITSQKPVIIIITSQKPVATGKIFGSSLVLSPTLTPLG